MDQGGVHVSPAQRQLFVAALFSDCSPASSPGRGAGFSRTQAHAVRPGLPQKPSKHRQAGLWCSALSPQLSSA